MLISLIKNFWKKFTFRYIRIFILTWILFIVPTFEIIYAIEDKKLTTNFLSEKKNYDHFNGWENYPTSLGTFNATGFFYLNKINGKYWFIDPVGNLFIRKGICHISYTSSGMLHNSIDPYYENVNKLYGTPEIWGDVQTKRLYDWGFNGIGDWSTQSLFNNSYGISYLVNLGISDVVGHYWHSDPKKRITIDYFDPDLELKIRWKIANITSIFVNDSRMIGYYTDGETTLGQNWETDLSLLQIYLQLPTNAPGQKVALQFLQNISNTIDNFNAIWGTKIKSWGDIEQLPINTFNSKNPISINQTGLFAQLVMERYGQLTYPIIKSYDPNHLVFGLRFADLPSDWILTGLKNYCDVFSPSGYYWTPRLERMDQIFTKFDKPILIHEFSWKAMDAWVFNAFYTGAIVYTQSQRGLGFEDYIKNFMAKPYAVGYDFYRWGNAPMDFFIYGENWGMVDLHDNPYEKFVNMVTKTNLLVESYHFNSDVPIKGRFFRINVGIQSILAIISIGIVMKYKYSYENQILEKQRVMEGKIHAIQGGKIGIIVIKILKWIYTILLITLFLIPIITQWLLKGG